MREKEIEVMILKLFTCQKNKNSEKVNGNYTVYVVRISDNNLI